MNEFLSADKRQYKPMLEPIAYVGVSSGERGTTVTKLPRKIDGKRCYAGNAPGLLYFAPASVHVFGDRRFSYPAWSGDQFSARAPTGKIITSLGLEQCFNETNHATAVMHLIRVPG